MYLSNLKSYSILTKKLQFIDISNFSTKNDLSLLFNPSFNKSHGVYIFEHNEKGFIYIGSSGKINSLGIKSSQGIRLRILQSSSFPYKIENKFIKFNFDGGYILINFFKRLNSVFYIYTESKFFHNTICFRIFSYSNVFFKK